MIKQNKVEWYEENTIPFNCLKSGDLRDFFEKFQPSDFIHCAALANTGICQKDPELGKKINIDPILPLLNLCFEFGCRFHFCSSDQVFSGKKKGHYSELDPSDPINEYGKQKAAAEKIIHEAVLKGESIAAPAF